MQLTVGQATAERELQLATLDELLLELVVEEDELVVEDEELVVEKD